MSKISNKQHGFGAAAVLLVIVIAVLVGSTGYYLYRRSHTSQQVTNSSSYSKQLDKESVSVQAPKSENDVKESADKLATIKLLSGTESIAMPLVYSRDTASVIDNIVSFTQPSNWRDDADTTAFGCGIHACLGQTMIVPGDQDNAGADYPDYFVVTVSAFRTSEDAKTVFARNWQDTCSSNSGNAYTSFTTDSGVGGFKYDFSCGAITNSSGKYVYEEHVAYGVSNASYVAILDVTFFNGEHKSFSNATNQDFGLYAASVEQIAKTLHIVAE